VTFRFAALLSKQGNMADSLRDDTSIDSIINKCDICERVVNLKLCARCRAVAYCSKNHQKQAWPEHKAFCKRSMQKTAAKTSDSVNKTDTGGLGEQLSSLSIDSQVASSAVTSTKKRVMHQCDELKKDEYYDLFTSDCDSSLETCHADGATAIKNTENNLPCDSEQHKTDINTENNAQFNAESDVTESGSSEKFILETEESVLHAPDYTQQAEAQITSKVNDKKMPYLSVIEGRNKTLGDYVIKCLNSYGICVLDNFLGDSKGTDILDDVMMMHEHGELTRGQLVNTNSPGNEVRGDVITWVDGSERGCNNVNFLISSIDAIMLHCQRSLGQYHIKGRSKV
jgi:hypoxia-inducible factor (prolyl hydroxylase)